MDRDIYNKVQQLHPIDKHILLVSLLQKHYNKSDAIDIVNKTINSSKL